MSAPMRSTAAPTAPSTRAMSLSCIRLLTRKRRRWPAKAGRAGREASMDPTRLPLLEAPFNPILEGVVGAPEGQLPPGDLLRAEGPHFPGLRGGPRPPRGEPRGIDHGHHRRVGIGIEPR